MCHKSVGSDGAVNCVCQLHTGETIISNCVCLLNFCLNDIIRIAKEFAMNFEVKMFSKLRELALMFA